MSISKLAALLCIAAFLVVAVTMGSDMAGAKEKNPIVVMETTLGNITLELDAEKAPKSVKNFMWYVDKNFYEGLIFHRVMKDFMIQGGGFTKDMVKKQGNPPVKNEADNGLSNKRGTIAMARTGDPHSATAQFYINVVDNGRPSPRGLDFASKTPQGWGYTVFGKVIDGMDVVDKIRAVNTVKRGAFNDVPATAVMIMKCYRSKTDEKTEKKETKKS